MNLCLMTLLSATESVSAACFDSYISSYAKKEISINLERTPVTADEIVQAVMKQTGDAKAKCLLDDGRIMTCVISLPIYSSKGTCGAN